MVLDDSRTKIVQRGIEIELRLRPEILSLILERRATPEIGGLCNLETDRRSRFHEVPVEEICIEQNPARKRSRPRRWRAGRRAGYASRHWRLRRRTARPRRAPAARQSIGSAQ